MDRALALSAGLLVRKRIQAELFTRNTSELRAAGCAAEPKSEKINKHMLLRVCDCRGKELKSWHSGASDPISQLMWRIFTEVNKTKKNKVCFD